MLRLLALVVLLVAGCAPQKLTPAQERVYEHIAACRHSTNAPMGAKFVQPDGRFWLEGGEASEQAAMKRCLSERFGYRWSE